MANANGWGDGSVNNNIGWGQGANNTIGWGNSQLTSWSGATDIDGGNLPSNSVAPAITGTAQEGQTLTCSTGTWSGSPTYTYQWKRNGNNIGSATNSTYTLVTADVGQNILCTVTATNFVGSATADSNTVTPTSSVDADAQAFITAASITDPTQQSAINQLVVGLKADGLWTSARAIYPFVGGTSTTHKWNLRNPLDTNAAFRLTFGGGITHSASGIKGNSLNGYYETYLNPSTEFSLATGGCGFIAINENLDTNTDFGAFQTGVNYRFQLWIKSGNTTYASMLSNSFYSASNTTSTIGFYGVTRQPNDNTNFYYIKDSTNTATAGAYQEPNSTINGFAFNIDNVLRQYFGERRQSFAYYGEGLTTAQAQLLRARVNTFNTTLGR